MEENKVKNPFEKKEPTPSKEPAKEPSKEPPKEKEIYEKPNTVISISEYIHRKKDLPHFAKSVIIKELKKSAGAQAPISKYDEAYDKFMKKEITSKKKIDTVPKKEKKKK